MFCPRCAAQNLEGAKFCRACGTNLEPVALALSDPASANVIKLEKSWPQKRSEGVAAIVKGIGLMAASLLIGVALGIFSNQADWIFVWMVVAGWMACWGVISLTYGTHELIESKSMRREFEERSSEQFLRPARAETANDWAALPEPVITNKLAGAPSVTEGTTELLIKESQTSDPAR